MKFFSTALAAFMAGSAMAAPVLNDCNCSNGKTEVEAPVDVPVDLPTACSSVVSVATKAPGAVNNSLPVHGVDVDVDATVAVVVQTVVKTVVDVETKIKGHLSVISEIVDSADIDADDLLEKIVALHVDLQVVLDLVPKLNGLVVDVDSIVEADVKLILELVARIEGLVAEVQVVLKGLVSLKAEILAVIGAELHGCLGLILSITAPVVKFALSVVATLKVDVALKVVVGELSTTVNKLTGDVDSITGIVTPVLKTLNLPLPVSL
ncbi:hypothetical protein C7999DRAFT_32692 [Corynascus novoguineensis]|uniref:Uncharacterized protein n=1 Tax=Corynascus novoguineensis TaxID=1126955 RepID=A0AAN7HET5_9PEZI|nr:hypothetical protein C7999DRAFT_32692 [Corynascus novoguineensis]